MRNLSILFLLASSLLATNCSTENTPIYTLSTNVSPSEAGSVNPSLGEYDKGTTVEITATPNDNWVFKGWQGDYTGDENPGNVTMDSDKSITAQFIKRQYPLTIDIEGEGSVGEEVVQQKTTDYPHGTRVQLTATPSNGWEFTEWQGDIEGRENPKDVMIESETSVTAVFEKTEYSLDLDLEGNGEIIINPDKNVYEYGEEVSITVNPESDWYFVHWKGDLEGKGNPVQLTVNQQVHATAVLDNSPFEGGNGSVQYPYRVSTLDQLQEIRNYPGAHFLQMNDIDAAETKSWNADGVFKGFTPLGTEQEPFSGSYNGKGFEIKGLFTEQPKQEFTGLFGYVEEGLIRNLRVLDADILGGTWAGGIAGYNDNGEIRNVEFTGKIEVISDFGGFFVGGITGFNNKGEIIECYSEGNISGVSGIGGLVGTNAEGLITRSYSAGEISGESSVGGLTGSNTGVIRDSYSSANVTGDTAVGGHTGLNTNDGFITHSYANGSVSGEEDVGGFVGSNHKDIESSFWDMESTKQNEGIGNENQGGATGLTTFQMTGTAAKENMPDFDWNGVWETTSAYPILKWQND